MNGEANEPDAATRRHGDAARVPGREAFSLPAGVHYLNCAYMSPLPRVVEEAGIAGMRRKRDPSSIAAADFFEEGDLVRRLFARLINAPDPARVALIPAASYGIAAVARNTPLEAGQNIVVLGEQFPSNVYSWRRLCARSGAELRTVERPASAASPHRRFAASGAGQGGAEWNARILEAIDSATAAVALAPVHWTDGTRFDLEAIGARAREVGAALVVDGTQSVGALPFDLARVQPDALICAAYKWLLGPYSIGLAWMGERYDGGEPLEENWIAREASEDFQHLVDYRDEYQPGALRYDVGERSNFVLVPMLRAALELLLDWGAPDIQAHCAGLAGRIVTGAAALGWTADEERWRAGHLFGLRAPARLDLAAVQAALAERKVAVSLRGTALRVSPHVYNDEAAADALLEGLAAAAGA